MSPASLEPASCLLARTPPAVSVFVWSLARTLALRNFKFGKLSKKP